MSQHAVHWHEGMFLRPHHFQASSRNFADVIRQQVQWDNHYCWGLRSIDIDGDALRNYRFVVNRLRARLRDGTLVNVPEDAKLAAIDLKGSLADRREVTISLAVPEVQLGRPNAGTEQEGARYEVYSADKLPDENTGQSERPIQFRKLNVKLMTQDEDPAGYQVLKIARVEKSARAEAAPQLAEAYIPPLLACDAWSLLMEDVLTPIYDRIGALVKRRAEQVRSRGIQFDSPSQEDRQLFEGLRVLNSVYAYMGVMNFAEGVHPLTAYAELARLVGELAIFGTDFEPAELPRYDHDDLGKCFYSAKQYIMELIDRAKGQSYFDKPFYGSGLRMQGDIEPAWLAPSYQLFVGVRCPMKAEDCIRLLTGKLNMKIGSADRVEEIFRLGQRGLVFAYAARPPRALPTYSDLTYFQVNRTVQPEEWENVKNTLTMALRLAEGLVSGNIDGQRTLTIRADGKSIPMTFTLYVVPPELAGKT